MLSYSQHEMTFAKHKPKLHCMYYIVNEIKIKATLKDTNNRSTQQNKTENIKISV